ncbi:MAG: LOG family protein [Phycisphaeraceae bacterium]
MTTTRSNSRLDTAPIEALDTLIRNAGGDPEVLSGKLIREMMHTCLKLVRDDSDNGELKLIGRSLKELRYAMKVFRPYRDVRKVSVFGSARTPEDHPHYQAAEAFCRAIARAKWMVITGAGDGIMRAGHGGAGRDASFGVAIRLPFETSTNEFIVGDEKLIMFRYFFTRKLMFVSQADAVALFPGGFGTHDEGFEVLTLVQTGKTVMIPLVMVDAPGDDYWKQWDQYVKNHLLAKGMISPDDLNLYLVTDDTDEAVKYVLDFYRNYHSQRYVLDDLVLRLQRPLTDAQLDALNTDFADLVKTGRIRQGGPLEGETDYLDLPRIIFHFSKRAYARLRLMIDQINRFDAANTDA